MLVRKQRVLTQRPIVIVVGVDLLQLFDCGSIEHFILLKLQPPIEIQILHEVALSLELDVALVLGAI